MADVILELGERFVFTPYVWPDSPRWPADYWLRQLVTIYLVTVVAGALLYLSVATLNYIFVFDRRVLQHKQILPNQMRREIAMALFHIPFMGVVTMPIFWLELKGYTYLYDRVEQYGLGYYLLSLVWFLAFTDMLVYFIHRGLHDVPWLYEHIHKPHHTWHVTTPFASHAFHFMDGFLQGVPYHIFPFLFPMHKYTYLLLFVGVNVWTVSIHDCNYMVPELLKPLVNGAAHHTDHHAYFYYNYGQYFTLWDRIGGTFRSPDAFKRPPLPAAGKRDEKKEA
jgi:lathosterol oxidase